MLRNPFTKWLWDGRRSILGWTGAVVFVGGGYAAFWPTVDNPDLQAALDNYPQALLEAINYTDIATAAGYLSATVFGLIVAVLSIVYTVSAGARTIAGDEEAGTLDLVLAHPVGRHRLAWQRFAALVVSIAVIAAGLWLALLLIAGPAGFDDIPAGEFAAMHLHLVSFATFFAALSFALGAATGRRSVALAGGSAAGVFGFLANGILPQVDGLEWTKQLSPFDWLNGAEPLRAGVATGDVLLMLGLAGAFVAAGIWAFGRRDVAV